MVHTQGRTSSEYWADALRRNTISVKLEGLTGSVGGVGCERAREGPKFHHLISLHERIQPSSPLHPEMHTRGGQKHVQRYLVTE